MSKSAFFRPGLIVAGVALPLTLVVLFSPGQAQEPPRLRAPLRIAQADAGVRIPADIAARDVPGGAALDPEVSKRRTVGVFGGGLTCDTCHAKPSAGAEVPAVSNRSRRGAGPSDDGWVLLNEYLTWDRLDKHFGSYAVLTNERSQQMGKVLGIVDEAGDSLVHRDMRCLACHSGMPLYEMEGDPDHAGLVKASLIDDVRLNGGVSCEGCHGPSGVDLQADGMQGWLTAHIQQGWRYMDPQRKQETFGYYDVRSASSKTRMCLSCHLGNAREGRVVTHEMYAAGHPPLPGFELATFMDQEPQHWRTFREKPANIRTDFLEKTADWRKSDWDPQALHDAQELMVGALVNLAEYLRLNADLIDADVRIPVEAKHWSQEEWPELAQFACFACHHDLQHEGWRLKRKPIGVPGRPTLHEWPFVLVEIVLKTANIADKQMLNNMIAEVRLAAVDTPFGDAEVLKTKGRMLADRLDALALELEQSTIERAMGDKLLQNLISYTLDEAADGEGQIVDYDSARQLVWAARIVYEELNGTSPKLEDLYANKTLDQVPGWYDVNQPLDKVQKSLASFDQLLLLDLRKGRIDKEKISDDVELTYLQWQAQLALPPIGRYTPALLQEKFHDLQQVLSPKKVTKRLRPLGSGF